jgi:hypothetical protein
MRAIGVFCMCLSLVLITACGDVEHNPIESVPSVDVTIDETKNTAQRPGVSQSFNSSLVVSDQFFNDADAMSVAQVQGFLEQSPYGRSWLANATTQSGTVAQSIVALSQAYQINPIILLSRIQVEASLVAPTQRPSQSRIDYAMGCGCADGTNCAYAPAGLEPQLRCAAQNFRELYDRSVNGTGWWRKGVSKATLDNVWVTPKSHATAALYAYTPWVLRGQGGTWLAWKVIARFDEHVGGGSAISDSEPELTTSTVSGTYRVRSGDSCWSAAQVLGCDYREMVNCSSSRGCDGLDVDDVVACSPAQCGASIEEPPEAERQRCSTYRVQSQDSCWEASAQLGCEIDAIVNCTEPGAGCAQIWAGDVLSCGQGCC